MKKVFLYLYPIREYTSMFLFHDDKLYDQWDIKRPLPILNECIQKRYRERDYQVVFVLFSDKHIFGIIPKKEDKIIYTDILFSENNPIIKYENRTNDFVPKYPNEHVLIQQLGSVQHLVIGGYYYLDHVKRIEAVALNYGIDTVIDLDMTELFFALYKQEDYFNVDEYNPKRYQEYIQKKFLKKIL